MTDRSLAVVLGGAFARVPGQGGLAWMVLQWALGLRGLGHEVLVVESLDAGDLVPAGSSLAASDNAAWFGKIVRSFGLRGALLLRQGHQTAGLPPGDLERAAAEADLVIDLAGGLAGTQLLADAPVRLYVDLDPAFTQLWHAAENIDMGFGGHTHFATVGLALEGNGHAVPDCGRQWLATLQPVFLPEWPRAEGLERDALTTVANWRGYGSIQVDGAFYGQKAHSVRELIELPRQVAVRCELALAIDPGEPRDLEALKAHGWELVDPARVAASPGAYRRFVQGSWAELGVAKSGYVASRCGWFSDRSVCYLASGRPVIAQDTGFGERLPVGEGLFSFVGVEEVAAAVEELRHDYQRHRTAARRVAEEHFASEVVLPALLRRVGLEA